MIKETLDKIVKNFDKREQDIILRRYGLKGEEETLESIGESYNISRERIRQLQNKISQQLQILINTTTEINEIINDSRKYLEPLGFKREKTLFKILSSQKGFDEESLKTFRFFAIFHKNIVFIKNDPHFHNFYSRDEKTQIKIRYFLKRLYFQFLENNHYLSETETINLINEEALKFLGRRLESEETFEILSTIKNLAKNPLNFWGIKNHKYISPKKLKDKIILILNDKNQPLHFYHLHKILEEFRLIEDDSLSHYWKKVYSVHSIKNELIRYQDFVLVGRGTYALKEWGLQQGKAKELLEKFIKEKGKIEKTKLWGIISSHRQIKKQTFHIYLNQLKHKGFKEENGYLIAND